LSNDAGFVCEALVNPPLVGPKFLAQALARFRRLMREMNGLDALFEAEGDQDATYDGADFDKELAPALCGVRLVNFHIGSS
jgi:hypothetical protein